MRRSVPGAMHDQELVLEEERLRNYGTGATRSEQAGQGSDEVDEKNDQIAHHRIVAGRGILRNLGRNNNSPARPPRLSFARGFAAFAKVGEKMTRQCYGGSSSRHLTWNQSVRKIRFSRKRNSGIFAVFHRLVGSVQASCRF